MTCQRVLEEESLLEDFLNENNLPQRKLEWNILHKDRIQRKHVIRTVNHNQFVLFHENGVIFCDALYLRGYLALSAFKLVFTLRERLKGTEAELCTKPVSLKDQTKKHHNLRNGFMPFAENVQQILTKLPLTWLHRIHR